MNKYNFQVGDYCFYDGDTDYECPLKVDGVTENDISVEGEGFLGGIDDVVVPYPITEEWLELNKIHLDKTMTVEWEGMDDIKYWYSNDHRIQITNLSNTIYNGFSADVRMFRAHMDNEDYETIGSLDVQYAHQLQHLCRDCNYKFEPKFK